MNVVSISSYFFLFCFVCLFLFCLVLFVCLFVCFFFPRLEELGYNTGEHKFTYNPLINFRDFIYCSQLTVAKNREKSIK